MIYGGLRFTLGKGSKHPLSPGMEIPSSTPRNWKILQKSFTDFVALGSLYNYYGANLSSYQLAKIINKKHTH